MPASWDRVRRAVDANPDPARFILTGSSIPPQAPAHTGAGRIVTVRMRPMALAERGLEQPSASLADLLTGRRAPLEGATDVHLDTYVDEIVRSGFPAIRRHSGRALRSHLDSYIDRVVEREFPEAGHKVRNQGALRRWLTAYAAATSTTTSFEKIRDAASAGEGDKPAKTTTITYRNTLEQLWMIEPVPAWGPTRNRLTRLTMAPKHQLVDPAISARLLGADATALVDGYQPEQATPRNGTLLGALFESLVTLSIRTYAQANEATVSQLRTRANEHEVDLIIERGDGRVVALEVKLAAHADDTDVRHLRWLADQIGPDLLDSAIITTGTHAYRRADGVGVIPASLLTA